MAINYTRARAYNQAQRYTAADLARLSAAVGYGAESWTDAALEAVGAWQKAQGLAADGGVGPITTAALPAAVPPPMDIPQGLALIRARWPELVFFADIAQHQEVTDWAAFAAVCPIVCVKVSEGVHHTDPRFASHWAQAKGHGVMRAGYHYCHHAWAGQKTDPVKAAEAFWRRIEHDPGELPCILDLESDTTRAALDAGMTPAQIVDWSMRWLELVERESGVQPILYNNLASIVRRVGAAAMAPLLKYPQWMAAYFKGVRWPASGPVSPYTKPADWQADAWQFTSDGRAPGVVGRIDLNVVFPTGRLAGVFNPPTKATSC